MVVSKVISFGLLRVPGWDSGPFSSFKGGRSPKPGILVCGIFWSYAPFAVGPFTVAGLFDEWPSERTARNLQLSRHSYR